MTQNAGTVDAPPRPQCPKCKEVELVTPPGRATYLLKCPSCSGVWLPRHEARLEGIAALMENESTIRPSDENLDLRTGLCPMGHGILIRAKVELDEPFYLDKCSECAGIWFDKGEWNILAQAHLLSNIDNLWNPAWQIRERQERADAAFEQKLSGMVGEEAFALLDQLADLLKDKDPRTRNAALAHLREKIEEEV